MRVLILLVLIVLLFLHGCREYFTDTEYTNVKRPCGCPAAGGCPPACSSWQSKITSVAPSTGTSQATAAPYIPILQSFYDTVYVPATDKPTEAQVDTFVSSSGTVVDSGSLKTIIMDAFHIDPTVGKAESGASEKGAFTPSARLQPPDGRDEVYGYQEQASYYPTDMSDASQFAEGIYQPVHQTTPRRPVTGIENIK
uniref:Uncharacterized protein n=1 Tax=viral metagenome TaxID=1070528 RepID=A0A6C0M3K0_9ZZZZ